MRTYQVLILFVSLYASTTCTTNGLYFQHQPPPPSTKWAFAQSYSWAASGNNFYPIGQQSQTQMAPQQQEQQRLQDQVQQATQQQPIQDELNRQAQIRQAKEQQAIQDERNRQAQVRQAMEQQASQEQQMRQAQIRLAQEQKALQDERNRQAQIRHEKEQQAIQDEWNRQAQVRQEKEQQAFQEQQMRQAQIRIAMEQQALQDQLTRQAQIRREMEQQAQERALQQQRAEQERALQQQTMEESALRQRALQREQDLQRPQQPIVQSEKDKLRSNDVIVPNESNGHANPNTMRIGNDGSNFFPQKNEFPQELSDEIVRKVMQETRGLPMSREDIEKIVRNILLATAYNNGRDPNSNSNRLSRYMDNGYGDVSNNNQNLNGWNGIAGNQRETFNARKSTTNPTEQFNSETECFFNCGNSQSNGQPIAAAAMAMAHSGNSQSSGQPIAMAMANSFFPINKLTDPRIGANSFTYTSV
ncbi:putative mediator of RNA polymerase II transcription subunit 26 [Bradysia coprophila]|uniref:putative mediator of RNA polymerase II transcription subunit 26 n=1 Tax=Bradysia coprophila TaxID=38358 RepID=UPI00187DAE36|nr:putative mediator of RNA polymerase II transcription subunit 26 [Bradysia coprophila]